MCEPSPSGPQPAGYVHPNALRALEEIGIEHHGRSKHVDEFRSAPFYLVVTVGDSAAEECPIWLGQGKVVHQGIPDAAKAEGDDDAVMIVFRQVRDDIAQQMSALLRQLTL